MGLFSGIKDAKPAGSFIYIGPGHYVARIDEAKVSENRKKEAFFAVNMTVLSVLSEEAAHKVGTEVTWLCSAKSDYFLGEVKAFFASVLDIAPDEVTEETINEVLEGKLLEGEFAEVVAWNKPTKAGKDFTNVRWEGCLPAYDAQRHFDARVIESYLGGAEKFDALVAASRAEAEATA